jgi:hypothetical protein
VIAYDLANQAFSRRIPATAGFGTSLTSRERAPKPALFAPSARRSTPRIPAQVKPKFQADADLNEHIVNRYPPPAIQIDFRIHIEHPRAITCCFSTSSIF